MKSSSSNILSNLLFTILFTLLFIGQVGAESKKNKIIKIPLWRGLERVEKMERFKSALYYHEIKDDKKDKSTAIIIAPGGSYHHLGLYNEGYLTGEFFATRGVAAFVLRYRTAQDGFHHPAMLEDIGRAIYLVRKRGYKKIGLIGYSAGGHLVTMASAAGSKDSPLKKGLLYRNKEIDADDVLSFEVDFVIPVYPVVSMTRGFSHPWSKKSLLGKGERERERERERDNEGKRKGKDLQIKEPLLSPEVLSMEKYIKDYLTGGYPPVYLVFCDDDPVVDIRNSLALIESFQARGVDLTYARYPWGGHGFGMLNNKFNKTFHWGEALFRWVSEKND